VSSRPVVSAAITAPGRAGAGVVVAPVTLPVVGTATIVVGRIAAVASLVRIAAVALGTLPLLGLPGSLLASLLELPRLLLATLRDRRGLLARTVGPASAQPVLLPRGLPGGPIALPLDLPLDLCRLLVRVSICLLRALFGSLGALFLALRVGLLDPLATDFHGAALLAFLACGEVGRGDRHGKGGKRAALQELTY
jgi:hypothetical protein